MKKTLFLILAVAFCISLSAQQYHHARDFKDITVKTRAETTYGGSGEENTFIPSLNPSEFASRSPYDYFDIGATHYISATNSNARNTVSWSPDGKTCAAVWTMGAPPTSGSGIRGTGINYFDNASQSWGPIPSLSPIDRIEQFPLDKSHAPGWGAHVYTENGECVISHSTADGGMVVNYREIRGEGDWTQFILKGPVLSNNKTDILWPSTFAVGNTIHMVCVTTNDAGVTYDSISTCPLYFRSTDGGKTWEEPRTFRGVMTNRDLVEVSADKYVVTARGNHVVIGYVCGLAAYLESFDGGDTWERHLVYDTDWDAHSEGVWVGPTMCANTIAVAIGDDDVVHVTYNAQMRNRKPGDEAGSSWYYPAMSGLYTWKEGQPILTHADFNFEYNYDEEKWISSEGYALVPNYFDAPELLGFDEFGFWGTINVLESIIKNFGNTGYVSHPRLIATKGKVYLMYSAIIEQPMLCPGQVETFFRGVFLTVSHDNGETYNQTENTSWLSYHPEIFWCDWSQFKHENDSTHNGMIDLTITSENGYPTMSVNAMNESLVFTWLNDMMPFPEANTDGSWVWQNTGYSIKGFVLPMDSAGIYMNTNHIWKNEWNWWTKVEEKEVINNLKIYPNPAGNIATIEAGTPNPYTLTVTNMMGQVVYSAKEQGKVQLNVANYPAGVYIVNVKTAHASASQKLIVK